MENWGRRELKIFHKRGGMRRGWFLLAIFCALSLSACATVGDNLTACRPAGGAKGSKETVVDLPAYLRQLNGAQVEKQKEGISITISSDSLFQPNADGVKLSNATCINFLANAGKKYPHTNIAVDVYTDCIHSEEQNLALTQLESCMIKRALEESGISAGRITAQGWGESKPVASNGTDDGRKANRRVTITFEPGKS